MANITKSDNVKSLLASNLQAVKSVLPKHLTPEKMLRIAFTSISRVPKLMECSQTSIINSVIEASIMGLEIGGPLGHAYLLPFKNDGKLEAQLIIGYQGYMDLAYRSDKITTFHAHPVYGKDVFTYQYGSSPMINHKPSNEKDPGKLIAAYAIAFFKGGGFDFEVVDERIAEVAKNRSKAKNSKESPWNQDDLIWTMWVKTAIRRLAKRTPLSPEIQKASAIESLMESGKSQEINHVDGFPIKEPSYDTTNKELTEKVKKASELIPENLTDYIEERISNDDDAMLETLVYLGFANVPSDKESQDKIFNEYNKRCHSLK